MSAQLPLQLELRRPARLEDFVPGDQGQILTLLAHQRAGGEPQLYLMGSPRSGRSHLLAGQCNAAHDAGLTTVFLPAGQHEELAPQVLEGLERFDLIAIDDVDRLAGLPEWEVALFNLFNRARETGCRLLFSAALPAAKAGFTLPDLTTRLGWGLSYRLKPLDDERRQQLLQNLAARRGLQMPPEVARYLVERHTRETAELEALVERLDRDSLAEQRRLSIPFVRERMHASR